MLFELTSELVFVKSVKLRLMDGRFWIRFSDTDATGPVREGASRSLSKRPVTSMAATSTVAGSSWRLASATRPRFTDTSTLRAGR